MCTAHSPLPCRVKWNIEGCSCRFCISFKRINKDVYSAFHLCNAWLRNVHFCGNIGLWSCTDQCADILAARKTAASYPPSDGQCQTHEPPLVGSCPQSKPHDVHDYINPHPSPHTPGQNQKPISGGLLVRPRRYNIAVQVADYCTGVLIFCLSIAINPTTCHQWARLYPLASAQFPSWSQTP